MKTFGKVLRWLDENAEKPIILVCVVTALLVIPYQVFCRYILGTWLKFNVDTSVAEELAIFCFIWTIYFAVPLSIKHRQSVRLTAFTDALVPERHQNILLILNNLCFLIMTGTIVVLSIRILKSQLMYPQVTATLRIPYFIPYLVLFLGFGMMCIRLVQDTVKLVRESGPACLAVACLMCAALCFPVLALELDVTVVLIGSLLLCLAVGMPIAVALGLSGIFAIFASGYLPMNVIAQTAFNSLDSFPMLAVFFFILAGIFMGRGGLSDQLISLADQLIGSRTGGLAMATVIACVFFGAISGSGVATVAAIGMITIPAMVERGYSRAFSAAIIACSGAIGVMIPPSNPFVLYGVVTNTSIGKLFMGGILPGLITAALLCLTAWYISKKNGWYGRDYKNTWGDVLRALWRAKWALMVPVIILGGIYGGIMTPTEAAAVAALYGLLVGILVLKGITRENILKVLIDSSVTTATVLIMVAMASIFGYVMAIEQIPDKIAAWMLGITSNKYTMLAIVNVLLLIAGALMESASATIILAPILMPVMVQVGVDPVHFGVIMVCNLAIGFVTPPVGQTLFVASAISGEKTERIAVAAMPLLCAMLIMLMLVTYIPAISLFLPGKM